MNKDFLIGKRVLVMGLGRFGGGVDVTRFACDAGAKVTITELASGEKLRSSVAQVEGLAELEFHLGGHDTKDFEQADIVVANPAVRSDNQFLQIARRNGKVVTSQIEIFFQLCPAVTVGVTGAAGKSTTAALAAHLLRAGLGRKTTKYSNVHLSGNIGNEPLLTIIDEIRANDLVVLELSSFQLEQLAQIRKGPKVALLTNLTPNHLDRYGTFDAYCTAKENIFRFQEAEPNSPAVSVFNAEDKVAAQLFEKYKNQHGRLCIKFTADQISKEIREQFGLAGRANLSNLAAAVTIARYFGSEDELIQSSLPVFEPLPHRLQLVAEVSGVKWYNDSKATTPESAIASLQAFEQPVVIIAGGYDKGAAFDSLGAEIASRAKAAILTGQTAKKIASAIENASAAKDTEKTTKIKVVNSLAEAVESAGQLAAAGDVVLLSPGCASYDVFDNFEHRGRQFVKLIREKVEREHQAQVVR
ncbi:MAG: UDP-N-acetylmuramoyl-L-alanine--D-glutamate ligase [Planctomycetota bacterium]|jgi:UDP-N-acetylmuramoylalanine--D-glutamate ligase